MKVDKVALLADTEKEVASMVSTGMQQISPAGMDRRLKELGYRRSSGGINFSYINDHNPGNGGRLELSTSLTP